MTEQDTVSLREYTQAQIDAVFSAMAQMSRMLDERYATQTKALDAAFVAAEKAVQTALASAEKAVAKAEAASDVRFAGVNEFRATLTDLVTKFQEMMATLMPRKEAEVLIQRNTDRLQEISLQMRDLSTREELAAEVTRVTTENARLREDMQNLNNRVTATEGRAGGVSSSRTLLIAIAAVAASIAMPLILFAMTR